MVVNLSLESPANPLRFDLFLMSDDKATPMVYSSPVPVERREDNSLMFVLGENPPNPLNLEIVLRKDFQGSFWPEVFFYSGNNMTQFIGKPQFTTGIPE
jgi:hypothetical protein